MPHILDARERRALDHFQLDHEAFQIKGQIPSGIGETVLGRLTALGLLETGPSARFSGAAGWRITDDGWRCMYGKTLDEMMIEGGPHHPLRVWQWPPEFL